MTAASPLLLEASPCDLWCLAMIPLTIVKYLAILILLETLLLRFPMFLYNYWYYKK